ncbi:MAG: hypothetical protein M1832_001398 [Thelocarpon impressellum]|nr:MAG: hypothetical protein M1832_001398 [Thelocarpon impressellum]
MEAAPLTAAHAHARAAFSHGHSSKAGSAVEEHALAAGEFARAAVSTGDAEALRTLTLLEQHHQKLSEILKFRSSHPVASQVADIPAVLKEDSGSVEPHEGTAKQSSADGATAPRQTSSPPRPSQPPTLPPPHRTTPRDLTSSIASNLASARGIPSSQRRRGAPLSPAVSDQHAGGRMLGSPVVSRADSGGHIQRSPTGEKATQAQPAVLAPSPNVDTVKSAGDADSIKEAGPLPKSPRSETAPSDEGFQRFYSTFENLISKLSAPLAFAGLPLANDDAPKAPMQADERERATASPDLTKMFSRAALRAVRDGTGQTSGGGGESFYVVPSTGGTISYAGILSRAEQERRAAAIEAEDEFVDAREMPSQPPSPDVHRHRRGRGSTGGAVSMANNKSMEELQLENQALKQLSDTLSRRLHMWEANAQSSSLALQQSLKAMQQTSPTPSDAGSRAGVAADDASTSKKEARDPSPTGPSIRELEEQLRAAGRENAKLKEVIGRYRSKWEKLKEGARMRRESGRGDERGGDERAGGGDD